MTICLAGAVLLPGQTGLSASTADRIADDPYLAGVFAGRTVLHFQIEIPEGGIRELSGHGWGGRHRPSTLVNVKEGDQIYTNVELHLKGGAGSYRPLEDNPGLTLNFEKRAPGQSFHGLKKFSLNNSVQDRTFLNEKICRELFNAAGSPTPRAGFTTVELNGRSLGVHVLAEGANKQFLRHYFENVHGNLYQTHGNQEITDRLDVNSGDNPQDNSGLRALVGAVREANPAARWSRLQQTLDVDRFLTFMALEVMLCHWDGYCMNQNNYRIFHDLQANRMVFIAHGMDQMFGRGGGRGADSTITPEWHGAVAQAVLSTPEGRRLYLARLGQLYTNLFQVDVLLKRVDDLSSVVSQALAEPGVRAPRDYERGVASLKARIQQRDASLARQLGFVAKPREGRTDAPVQLTGWSARVQEGHPDLNQSTEGARHGLLHISASQGKASASWRTRMHLDPGRYRFEGEVRVHGVGSADDWAGARLRVSGARPLPRLSGDAGWSPMFYEFQVQEDREVEFVCELRALDGEAWFDPQTLRVVRVE
jgi:hypothetical protein